MKSNNSNHFINLKTIIPNIILDIRYYTNNNFIGKQIDGYNKPIALLTKEAATSLKEVNNELSKKGYKLKIFDAYRPTIAVDHFIRWSKDLNDQKMKKEYYPDIDKSQLIKKGYIAEQSSHSRGSTIDLTLVDSNNQELDMGGTFDYFGEISFPNYPNLTKEQLNNRQLLKDTMLKHGFIQNTNEWWHFTLLNEPFPNTYFIFPITN